MRAGATAGEATLDVPPDLVGEPSSVVVSAQKRVSGRLPAASGVPLRRER